MSEVAKKEMTKFCLIAGGISLVVAIGVVAAYHFTVAKDEDEGKEPKSGEK
jgi:nitrate reductase NapE component